MSDSLDVLAHYDESIDLLRAAGIRVDENNPDVRMVAVETAVGEIERLKQQASGAVEAIRFAVDVFTAEYADSFNRRCAVEKLQEALQAHDHSGGQS